MSIGHSPNEPQWTPDMRKNAEDVTEAEKREAKRRIQGNLSQENSSEGSGDDDTRHHRKSMPTVDTLKASAM